MTEKPWVVHKFGGTSVGSTERFLQAAKLIAAAREEGIRPAVVVSAMSRVTDSLLHLAVLAESRDSSLDEKIAELAQRHLETLEALVPPDRSLVVWAEMEDDLQELREILRGVWLLRECSDRTRDYVAGLGEVWSTRILTALLQAQGMPARRLDTRKILMVEPVRPNVNVLWEESRTLLHQALADFAAAGSPPEILVITGFVALTPAGVATTLGRNGSDFSASIFGYLLDAAEVVIWTDVDGVLSADPRKVPDAVLVPELNYREMIELAYFGAKVLHPGAMAPAIAKSLPIKIKNSFRPELPGTVVRLEVPLDPRRPVKGFAVIEPISLLNMEGTGMMGVPGIAGRLFQALHERGISVIMISQASSEHSICFAVPCEQGRAARTAAEESFALEFRHGKVQRVELQEPCAILAVVGEGMAGTVGISGRLFGALGKAGINVRAIAQGSSERNISLVTDAHESARALRAVHAGFYLSRHTLSLGIIGAGNVGGALLDQLARERRRLRDELDIDLRVRGIMTSRKMRLLDQSSQLSDWRACLAAASGSASSDGEPNLEAFVNHVRTDSIPFAAIVDCTSAETMVGHYQEWFDRGIHVITPNKKAGSSPRETYQAIFDRARERGRHFLYETTVCAGLPVINTLRDLVQTGDTIKCIEGMFSGSLSFIFTQVGQGIPFAEALREAMKKGFTEPDPRDDLSGLDVARKTLILAREIGLKLNLSDIPIRSLVPEAYRGISTAEFKDRLDEFGFEVQKELAEISRGGLLPRYVGSISPETGARVELTGVPPSSVFARAGEGDNIVSFRTRRYDTNPLIVQGPGAGPEVTAAGVFADILRLCSFIGGEG
jgi:aspartokinase/homoserine dehydrogenase 1